MSAAFCKEEDNRLLSDISPTIPALKYYLRNENNGVRVNIFETNADDSVTMTNGLTYIRKNNKWELL